MYGIDLSNNNSPASVDWSGVEFVFIKATESTTFIDKLYLTFKAEAINRGILWAPYHFAHPDKNDPGSEARYFLDHSDEGPIPCALDFETRPGYNPLAIMGTSAAVAWCLEFAAVIESAGRRTPYLYTFRSYADALYPRLPSLPKWLAGARGYPLYKVYAGCTIAIEQYASDGGLDRNTSYLPFPSQSPAPGHKETDDMKMIIQGDASGEWWITDYVTKRYIASPAEAESLINDIAISGAIILHNNMGPFVRSQAFVDAIPTVPTSAGAPGSGPGPGPVPPTHFQGTIDINAV